MWKIAAAASGLTITLLIGVANISYSMSLASGHSFGVPNAYIFAAMGAALDILMVCAPFAYETANRARKLLLAVTFAVASLYSIHAMNGFLKSQTITTTISGSYQKELELRLAEKRPDFKAIERIRDKITPVASPVQGFELILAISLWFLNATIWYSFFGSNLTATLKRYMEDESHGGTHGEEARTDSGSNHRSDRRDGVRGYSKNKRSLI